MPEHIERTCKNCLHIAVCYRHEHYGWEETNAGCNDFKSAVDVVKVVHGEWIKYKPIHYKCSICDNRVGGNTTKYCSECGAKMDGKKSD